MSTASGDPVVREVDQQGWAAVGNEVEAIIEGNQAMGASSFQIPLGAVTAIIGPNGSGKSTLLNLLAGLIEPSAGSLQVLGKAACRRERRGRLRTSIHGDQRHSSHLSP